MPTIKREEYAAPWSKIFHTKNILESSYYSHVFFLDADAVVLNRHKKIEDVIAKMKTSIAFSANGLNGGDHINSGSFIATKESLPILNECIRLSQNDMMDKKRDYWHEQSIITYLYESGVPMDVFDMNEINSFWLYDIDRNDGQFIYHFMARPLHEKIEIAKILKERSEGI